MVSQSYSLDWDAISGFKNLINRDNTFFPSMVGRIQKFLLEICNREECSSIYTTIFYSTANIMNININSCDFRRTHFEIQSDMILDNNYVIDSMFSFIKEILNSNIYLMGLSQDSVATMNQLSLFDDKTLYGYLNRALTIFRYENKSSNMSSKYITHVMLNYSYAIYGM